MKGMDLSHIGIVFIFALLTGCSSLPKEPSHLALMSHQANHKTPAISTATYNNTSFWEGDTALIWSKLQRISSAKLALMQQKVSDPTQSAWLQLAKLSKQKMISTQQLASELITWQNRYPSHPANQLLPNQTTLNALQSEKLPKKIALLLPQSGPYGSSGKTLREGFLNAYFSHLNQAEVENVKFYDTAKSKNIASLYQQAVAEGAEVVIGPLLKENVYQLSNTSSFSTPILALNYSDATQTKLPSNFYEFGLLPEDEALQIALHARQAGLAHAIVIAPENTWGKRLVAAFSTNWKANGGNIEDAWYFSPRSNFNQEVAHLLNINLHLDKELMQNGNDKHLLEQQRRQDFDVIFLFSKPQDARVIVPLLRYYYAGTTPIYAVSSAYSQSPSKNDTDLNGVIICDIPWNIRMQPTGKNDIQLDRLYAVGQDAYALSRSLSRLAHLPNFPIYGKTGALMLSSQQQIHRRLPCVTIQHGRI